MPAWDRSRPWRGAADRPEPHVGRAARTDSAPPRLRGVLLAVALMLPALGRVGRGALLTLLRLRWSFAVPIAVGWRSRLALEPSAGAPGVRWRRRARSKRARVSAGVAIGVLWPFWLVLAGVAGCGQARAGTPCADAWRARRTRTGADARPARASRSRRRRQARQHPVGERGTLMGQTRAGEPVLVGALRAHAMIVGGSGAGKTTTAQVLLEGEVAGGRGFVILDGKGGRELPAAARPLSRRPARRQRRPASSAPRSGAVGVQESRAAASTVTTVASSTRG